MQTTVHTSAALLAWWLHSSSRGPPSAPASAAAATSAAAASAAAASAAAACASASASAPASPPSSCCRLRSSACTASKQERLSHTSICEPAHALDSQDVCGKEQNHAWPMQSCLASQRKCPSYLQRGGCVWGTGRGRLEVGSVLAAAAHTTNHNILSEEASSSDCKRDSRPAAYCQQRQGKRQVHAAHARWAGERVWAWAVNGVSANSILPHRLGSATWARCSRLPHSSVTCATRQTSRLGHQMRCGGAAVRLCGACTATVVGSGVQRARTRRPCRAAAAGLEGPAQANDQGGPTTTPRRLW